MKMRNNKQEGVTGALFIHCDKCGCDIGLYSKEPKKYIRCKKCGNSILLEGLRNLVAFCECGFTMKYLTNIKDGVFDIPCRNCEAPIAVEWNAHKNKYQNCK